MRALLVAVLLLVFPAAAAAQVQSPPAKATGGAETDPTTVVTANAFRVAPDAIRAGTATTAAVRVSAAVRRVRVRIILRPQGGGAAVGGLRLGWIRSGTTVKRRWRPRAGAGAYTAELEADDGYGHSLLSGTTFPVSIKAAPEPVLTPVVTSDGVFPILGSSWDFGNDEARFGAGRNGHSHQGQDVFAPEGTPLVSPRAGVVFFRGNQDGGAGHYLVITGDDGRDYVFMHLVAGSELVAKGDVVRAGQQIGQVGHTGDAVGNHLHFEIWPGGWYAKGSAPIDPLSDLLRWSGRGSAR